MTDTSKALEALSRIFNYCEEIDNNIPEEERTGYNMLDDIDIIRRTLKALENQKIGHWITWKEAGNEIPSETRFECSVCHDSAQTLCNGLDLLSPYCPNCGAKMKGDK